MGSPARFGYEWGRYSEVLPDHELQFAKWVLPLERADFDGATVLDAGCGMGRNSFWALKWGARRVVAIDVDKRSLDAARKNLSGFPSAEVMEKSIYDTPWQNEFDIAFSIGVIHHLEDPERGVRSLARAVKPGGKVLIWVYGREGNEWIVRWVSPIRKIITSRLPPRLLDLLTYFVSVPFLVAINILPIRQPYLAQLSGFGFHHVHAIIFDQLLPAIAHYYPREEAENLILQAGLQIASVRPINGISWAVLGVKPAQTKE